MNSSPLIFSSLLAIENLQNHSFSNSMFSISIFGEIPSLKKTQIGAAPRLCPKENGPKLPKLGRARDLCALLSERRLLSAEPKQREAPGDGAQLPFHRLYKISLSFILRHRPPFLPSFPLLLSFSTSSSSAEFY